MRPKPKKRFSQVFLIDKNIQEKIAAACVLTRDDNILEIGPGRGEITALLLPKVRRLTAVEIDPDLCRHLRKKFGGLAKFELINQDILRLDLSGLAKAFLKSKKERFKVVANLPYHIASPILLYLLGYLKHIKAIYVMLQKELGFRLVAAVGSKDYSKISCLIQYRTRPKILFNIKSGSFWPRPKVDSCFVELKVPPHPSVQVKDENSFLKMIRIAFGQRRKAIKNSLARVSRPGELTTCLKNIKINPNSRAEDLSLKDFAKLSDSLPIPADNNKNILTNAPRWSIIKR